MEENLRNFDLTICLKVAFDDKSALRFFPLLLNIIGMYILGTASLSKLPSKAYESIARKA